MATVDRGEAEIFDDLRALTGQRGYAHVLAHICNRDDLVGYGAEYQADDLEHMFSRERLIRTEITTLLGLMVQHPLDLSLPDEAAIEAMVSRTDELMEELHEALNRPIMEAMLTKAHDATGPDDLWKGAAMREPIFYASESAYSFQYREFFAEKHGVDDAWLQANMGFTSSQAKRVAQAICALMDARATNLFARAKRGEPVPPTKLSNFEFTAAEVAQKSNENLDTVNAIFKALTLSGDNAQFKELGDFNAVAATPLLPTGRDSILLFQQYAIYEALYESPFFWMLNDSSYKQKASAHRGAFVEQFSYRRLAAVFGKANVHTNVNIFDGKDIVAEADVLVVFGDRLIILQAKAKKLTLAARKGNDGQLRSDFAAAIQKANEQCWECANAVLSGRCRLEDDKGNAVVLPENIKEIYPVCVISDHYPALAFQASQYLEYKTSPIIQAPFVMDVFLLDVLAEMLYSPLRLLSYIRLRIAAVDKVMMSHELTALAFHLKRNLWLDSEFDMLMLDDSIAAELDVAMTVRREGFPGKPTPAGILTVMSGTSYEHIITQIERRPDPATLELGFLLLTMSEDSCRAFNTGIESIIRQTRSDGKSHDFTFGIQEVSSGISVQCNPPHLEMPVEALRVHCHKRKYSLKAATWFGISIGTDGKIQFGVNLDFPWERSAEMDLLTKGMKPPTSVAAGLKALEKSLHPPKPGRNEPCSCGSGKKFKKCCYLT